jgi:hypothetical protein
MHQTEIFLMKQVEKYKTQVERVRELHTPILYGFSTKYNCSHCRSECVDYSSDTPYVPYPCPTIQVLDGEQ